MGCCRVAGGFAAQDPDDFLGSAAAQVDDRGVGGERDVRGDDHPGMSQQVGRDRGFLFQHVQAGAAEVFGSQRVDQGGGVDQAAAADVDQERALRHEGEFPFADQVPGLRGQGCVQDDHVAGGQQFVQGQDGGAAGVIGRVRGGDHHLHAQRLELGHGGPADPAEPDDPAGQGGQPAQPGAGRVPAARADLTVGGDQSAGVGERQADGVVGDSWTQ